MMNFPPKSNNKINSIRNTTLTNDSEVKGVSQGRRGGYLTLVPPLVVESDVPDPQLPEVGQGHVVGGEPLVRRVGVPAHRQQVHVSVPDPGNLGENESCSFTHKEQASTSGGYGKDFFSIYGCQSIAP